MHATHLYPRRSLIALVAAALAAIAIAIPVRLVADDLGSGGSTHAAPATPVTAPYGLHGKPYWIEHPLASPLRELRVT